MSDEQLAAALSHHVKNQTQQARDPVVVLSKVVEELTRQMEHLVDARNKAAIQKQVVIQSAINQVCFGE